MPTKVKGTTGVDKIESGAVITNPAFSGDATVSGSLTIAGETAATQNSLGVRNRIINGDMRIDQRNAGASASAGLGYFVVDRITARSDGVTFGDVVGQQSTDVPNAQFKNSIKLTVNTALTPLASNSRFGVDQRIEGYNIADIGFGSSNSNYITLSFWCKSSLTGTYCVNFYNTGLTRQYVTEFTINASNTWERKTFTIPVDTSGTWDSTNGNGLGVHITLAASSTLTMSANAWTTTVSWTPGTTNQVNWLATVGNTFYITAVQLEVGTEATPFEHRPYDMELQRCMRYFQRDFQGSLGQAYSSSDGIFTLHCAVPMRASPTLSQATGVSLATDIIGGGQTATSQGISGAGQSATKTTITYSGLSGRTTWQALAISNTGTQLSAEL